MIFGLSIEDWVLPTGTVPAVKDKKDFLERLGKAVKDSTDDGQAVLTWGYHPAFYGPLTKAELDGISTTKPVIVWGRSCHEMFFNTATLARAGITGQAVAAFPETARAQSNLADGHFWEQGLFAVLPHIASFVASPQRLQAGLELTRD